MHRFSHRCHITLIIVGLWLFSSGPLSAAQAFKGSITFQPPESFYSAGSMHDPGDDPFSGVQANTEYLSSGEFGQISFAIRLVGFTVGEGKIYKFQTVDDSHLCSLMEEDLRKCANQQIQAKAQPVTLGGLHGAMLTAAVKMSEGAPFATNLIQQCWLQIETNLILQITATSPDKTTFTYATNAVATVKVNKSKLYDALRPPEPKMTKDRLISVTSGTVIRNGETLAAFFIRAKTNKCFFVSSDIRTSDEILSSMDAMPAKVKQFSADTNVFSQLVLHISRYGNGKDEIQRTCSFEYLSRRGFPQGVTKEDVILHPDRYFVLDHAAENDDFWVKELSFADPPVDFKKKNEYFVSLDFFIWELLDLGL